MNSEDKAWAFFILFEFRHNQIIIKPFLLLNNSKKGIAKWPADALKCILEIWKKSLCEGTLNRKSIHIYTQMSIQMENFGCNFSPREIRKNIIDLIRKYRREKIKIKNGAIGNDSHLYNALDYLIGNNRVYQWEELMQKITGGKKDLF